MSALFIKSFFDLRRHLGQAVVIAFIVMLASGTGVIALSLMAQSSNPYDTAFARQNGAHLQAYFNARKVPVSALQATVGAIGAIESAGPFPSGSIVLRHGANHYFLNVIARSGADATVDRIRVVCGRWAAASDEIVITKSFADLNAIGLGAQVTDVNVASTPRLMVVGEVVDIDQGQADLSTQTAFVTPSAFTNLTPSSERGYVMLYRFADSPTEKQLASAVISLRHAVPAGALGATVDYVLFKEVDGITSSLVLTMLLAFSVFALAAAGLVVANLVAGTVVASYRDIGIMKAVGFTPRQVASVYVVEMLIPALAGCAIGIPVGMLLAQPLVAESASAVGLSSPSTLSPAVALFALAGALLVVTFASLLPASRAGRLRSVDAMTRGVAPNRARASRIGWLASRLRLPDTVVLGSRDAFARPLRGLFTTIAIVVGVASAIFAIGLRSSLDAWAHSLGGDAAVIVSRTAGYSDQQAVAAITRQRGVSAVVGIAAVTTSVRGITDQVQTQIFRGDSGRLGLGVVNGRWFTRPGEALAPKATFADAHVRIGDVVTVDYNGTPVRLTMVGEVSSVSNFGHLLMVDAGSLPGAASDFQPHTYDVVLRPGIDAAAFSRAVEAQSPSFLSAQANDINAGVVGILDTVGFALAAILIGIALAGAFNTQLLMVRERRRELATLKAVGMTPRQLVVMVSVTGAVVGIIGGVIALPLGLVLHRVLLTLFAAQAGSGLANGVLDVFSPWALPLFVLLGVAVAVAGGLLPARSAARTPVAVILHAE